MNKKTTRRQWLNFLLVIAGFVILLTALYVRLISVREEATEKELQSPPTPVSVTGSEPQDIWLHKSVTGRVEGAQSVTVYTEVTGWVEDIKVNRGESVSEDGVILTLEDQTTGYNLKQAEGSLNSARAELQEAKRKYEQNKVLFEKGIIARDTLESSLNHFKASEASVQSMEAAYRIQKWNYERLTVTSPIGGTVIEVYPDKGQELQINDMVARIVNNSQMKVVSGVSSEVAKRISAGTRVEIIPNEDIPGASIEGTIIGISRDADEASSLYSLEISITGKGASLLPGEVVTVKIPYEKLENVIRIPVASLYSDNDHYYLFVTKDKSTANRISIEQVKWINDTYAAISHSSVPKDSMIITEGSAALIDGERIAVTE